MRHDEAKKGLPRTPAAHGSAAHALVNRAWRGLVAPQADGSHPHRLPAALARAVMAAVGSVLAFDARHASELRLGPLAWLPLRAANERRIRQRCAVLRVSDDVAVCRVLGRYKMYVEPRDYGHAVHLMFDGYWEMHVTQVVAALVRPGMVAVDVGAHQGYYTLLLAGLVGGAGRVHAVEPNPKMVALLRRSLSANGFRERVLLHAQPVAGRGGELVAFQVDHELPGGLRIVPAVDADPEPGLDGAWTATLDEVIGDSPVDFIKIDAEGAETAIWDGMRGILARRAPLTIVVEFLAANAPDPATFLAEVQAYGFSLSCIHDRHGLRPVTAEEILAAPHGQEWILALRRG